MRKERQGRWDAIGWGLGGVALKGDQAEQSGVDPVYRKARRGPLNMGCDLAGGIILTNVNTVIKDDAILATNDIGRHIFCCLLLVEQEKRIKTKHYYF